MTNRGEASNLEYLGDIRDLHKARAIAAYAKTSSPSLTRACSHYRRASMMNAK
jgi:hypothetical protein